VKHPATDYRSNPFAIDGVKAPQTRSPLAILDVDLPELEDLGTSAVLKKALAALERDPDLALVYGQKVSRHELEWAAERLRDPEGRLHAELLDPPHHEMDAGDLGELRALLDRKIAALGEPGAPRPSDLGLVAALLTRALPVPSAREAADFEIAPPELPSANGLISGLI
jgi:hypothetical protein